MIRFLKQALLVLILIMIIIFSVQNFGIILIKFINWELKIPLFVAFLLVYILGAISGSLLFSLIRTLAAPAQPSGGKHTESGTET
jgi:lipopolysaccharide assembly protein A